MRRGVVNISEAAASAMHTMIALAAEPEQVRATAAIAEMHVSEAHLAQTRLCDVAHVFRPAPAPAPEPRR